MQVHVHKTCWAVIKIPLKHYCCVIVNAAHFNPETLNQPQNLLQTLSISHASEVFVLSLILITCQGLCFFDEYTSWLHQSVFLSQCRAELFLMYVLIFFFFILFCFKRPHHLCCCQAMALASWCLIPARLGSSFFFFLVFRLIEKLLN